VDRWWSDRPIVRGHATPGPARLGAGPFTYRRPHMISLGIILLILGFLLDIGILWTIGIILLVIGVILFILGALGNAVGGRRHWY
jgi:hypothetical protein